MGTLKSTLLVARSRRESGPAKQRHIVPVPVALKPAFGIVRQLRVEELRKSRVARLDLIPRRPRLIGEIEPPAILDRPIDDPAKIGLGLPDAFRRMHAPTEENSPRRAR